MVFIYIHEIVPSVPRRPVILYFKSLQNSTTVCMTLAELASVFDVVFRVSLPSILRFQL